MGKTRNRWIMYAFDSFGGFRVTAHESLDWCKESLAKFSLNTGDYRVSASLYPYTDEDWKVAREYQNVGCPFDYPTKVIERGRLSGAFRIENA